MIDRDGLERAVLGGILLAPDVLHDMEGVLDPGCFTGNRLSIWTAVSELHRRGDSVDILGVVDEVSQGAESQGVERAVTKLCEAGAGLSQVRSHARRLRCLSALQDVEKTAGDLVDLAKDARPIEEDVTGILDEAMQRLYRLADREGAPSTRTLGDDLEAAFEAFETRRTSESHITGLSTGLHDLDHMLGGLKPGQLTLVAGRPAMGKSAWALTVAINAARSSSHEIGRPAKVVLYSLEMSNQQLVTRMIASEALIDCMHLIQGRYEPAVAEHIKESVQSLRKLPLMLDDTPNLTVQRIRGKLRRLKASQGVDLAIIDYLQLMGGEHRSESRQVEISGISRGLKMLSKELSIPIIALAQLSREVERSEDKRPRLAHLRESGALEQDADVVMFLFRPGVYDSDKYSENETELIVAKNREGAIGKVNALFYPSFTKFTPADQPLYQPNKMEVEEIIIPPSVGGGVVEDCRVTQTEFSAT